VARAERGGGRGPSSRVAVGFVAVGHAADGSCPSA
jgi:hypothetical protein